MRRSIKIIIAILVVAVFAAFIAYMFLKILIRTNNADTSEKLLTAHDYYEHFSIDYPSSHEYFSDEVNDNDDVWFFGEGAFCPKNNISIDEDGELDTTGCLVYLSRQHDGNFDAFVDDDIRKTLEVGTRPGVSFTLKNRSRVMLGKYVFAKAVFNVQYDFSQSDYPDYFAPETRYYYWMLIDDVLLEEFRYIVAEHEGGPILIESMLSTIRKYNDS